MGKYIFLKGQRLHITFLPNIISCLLRSNMSNFGKCILLRGSIEQILFLTELMDSYTEVQLG